MTCGGKITRDGRFHTSCYLQFSRRPQLRGGFKTVFWATYMFKTSRVDKDPVLNVFN